MSNDNILFCLKFVLIFTYSFYLYCRKKHKTFLHIALCGYFSLLLGFILPLRHDVNVIILLAGLVVGLILSYKELESLGNKGLNAKEFLNPDIYDFIVLGALIIVWAMIKTLLETIFH